MTARECLIQEMINLLSRLSQNGSSPRILNIGASKSLYIEKALTESGCRYICDRLDVDDCSVEHPSVDQCWVCSAEEMTPVAGDRYDAACAMYVLEHIPDLNRTAREIHRVLKPGGIFVAAIPNPTAPEFVVARHSPLWFHKLVRREETWHTEYSYSGIRNLTEMFQAGGMTTDRVFYYSNTRSYVRRIPVLNLIGTGYDKLNELVGIKRLLGNVCVVFRKPE